MTDRYAPLCLATIVISLFSSGCQETSAPAASDSQEPATASASETKTTVTATSVSDSPTNATDGKEDKDSEQSPGESPPTTTPVSNPAPPAKLRDFTFDDLKFDIEKGGDFKREMLTDKIEGMVDTPIRIRGYILPSFQQTGLKQFVLVRDNMECCFGPGAALFDCILVEMNEGKSANFSVRPVAVEGKFTINEFLGPDGKHLAVFHLQGEAVK